MEAVDERIRQPVDDMLETMYAADGVGLAATQVNVHERVVVIDTSKDRDEPRVLINPEITKFSEGFVEGEEGCLSVPQTYDKVPRHAQVTVRALGRDGQPLRIRCRRPAGRVRAARAGPPAGQGFRRVPEPAQERIKTKMVKKAREEEAEAKQRSKRF